MRVLFCGGGTAGHITPSIALAEEIKKRYSNASLAFVGRKGGGENQLITNRGFRLFEINVKGFSRSIGIDTLKTVKLYFQAKKESKRIIEEFEPEIVFGTGGYVSAPVISAASSNKIPCIIHESNAYLGFSARMLAKRCNYLLLGVDIKTKFKNATFVGNPVSDKFGAFDTKYAKSKLGIPQNKKLILSVGGSIGAQKLNEAVAVMMKDYVLNNAEICHIHSSGKRYYAELSQKYPELCGGESTKIIPFIENMPLYLCAADLVICRCGAMTLAEAAYSGCPTVMIPSPNVAADHQRKNAIGYEKAGAGVIIDEDILTPELLTNKVKSLLGDENLLSKMSFAAKNIYKDNPKDKIIETIESLIP